MKSRLRAPLVVRFVFIVCFATEVIGSRSYFVDSIDGDDGAAGTSEAAAWRSLSRASAHRYEGGDRLLFRSGSSWRGSLLLKGSGKEGSPIVVGRYGAGPLPRIDGDGKTNGNAAGGPPISCAIRLYNQQYWSIQDLEITNYNSEEESGRSLEEWERRNQTEFADVAYPEPDKGGKLRKVGILVQARGPVGGGVLKGFRFSRLVIHGINGDMDTKDNGGVYFKAYDDGSGIPVRFDDVFFEENVISDVDRTGVSNQSDFDDREIDKNVNWTPNRNWVFRGNLFRRTGANALIVRVAEAPLMEGNVFDTCAIKGSGNAAFNFNTDDALWQFNEFRYTKANRGDVDAGGVDSDFRSKRTVIQYNHLHDNDFGMLVTGGPDRFNDGTIVRGNLIVGDGRVDGWKDDGKYAIRVSGSATNTLFVGNTIIVDEEQSGLKIAYHKRWKTWPAGTRYERNVIVNLGSGTGFDFGESRDNRLSDNRYFGNTVPEPLTTD